ncbi:MAG: peptidoglycan DD-metalloendopeptidase family protein [Candidatus Protistobacter heckmanni]|nr:peptidoglycan DD-metalloendopeptidase family protein [Candidatus Protistobacter heckmanni]
MTEHPKASRSAEPVSLPRAGQAACLAGGLAALLVLGACSSTPTHAPVIERSSIKGGTVPEKPVAAAAPAPLPPVDPGYYRVKRGDTLYRIALENGQSYRDLAAWNNLANPNQIEVDQVLRVAPPEVSSMPVRTDSVEARPIEDTKPAEAVKPAEPAKAEAPKEGADIAFAWPAKGQIIEPFDEAKNKGIDIAGKAGDPVRAAAEGKVIYAGVLRGYGNLVIIKHDNTFLSAYGHNRSLSAKEGVQVKAGQVIAEMGSSEADRVKLHFEIRRNGKPVDPSRFLPAQ